MNNEALYLAISVVGSIAIVLSMRLGKESLFVAAAANLLLVSAVGSELISIAGSVTNAGNAFYALVIFCLAILVEFFGKKTAQRAIWAGFIGVVIFVLMTQITIRFGGSPFTMASPRTFEVVFEKVPRIAFASLFAYLISAHVYVWLHDKLRKKVARFNSLAFRYLGSTFAAQIVDSVLFSLLPSAA